MITTRAFVGGFVAAALLGIAPLAAQETVKVGLLVPLSGPFTPTGKQMVAGAKLYMQQNGDTVAGKKIELIIKDDGGVPDNTKRLAQELIVNDKVAVLAGFALTPGALAVAPLATEAKVVEISMLAATGIVTDRSPFIVRASFSVPQSITPLADWAAKNGIKSVVSVVSDFAPGIDVETNFKQRFEAGGGKVVDALRVPLASNDFAPALQRVTDTKPDAVMVFVPASIGPIFLRQMVERGLDKSGMKIIADGSLTEDDILNPIGDAALGIITSQPYSAAHDSPENKAFVAAFKQANAGARPNFVAVHAYDGMRLVYEALKKTNGASGGEALVEAMKGQSWVSPRGPVSIDPATREMTQNVYIRKVERKDGELYNIEFETVANVKGK